MCSLDLQSLKAVLGVQLVRYIRWYIAQRLNLAANCRGAVDSEIRRRLHHPRPLPHKPLESGCLAEHFWHNCWVLCGMCYLGFSCNERFAWTSGWAYLTACLRLGLTCILGRAAILPCTVSTVSDLWWFPWDKVFCVQKFFTNPNQGQKVQPPLGPERASGSGSAMHGSHDNSLFWFAQVSLWFPKETILKSRARFDPFSHGIRLWVLLHTIKHNGLAWSRHPLYFHISRFSGGRIGQIEFVCEAVVIGGTQGPQDAPTSP